MGAGDRRGRTPSSSLGLSRAGMVTLCPDSSVHWHLCVSRARKQERKGRGKDRRAAQRSPGSPGVCRSEGAACSSRAPEQGRVLSIMCPQRTVLALGGT